MQSYDCLLNDIVLKTGDSINEGIDYLTTLVIVIIGLTC